MKRFVSLVLSVCFLFSINFPNGKISDIDLPDLYAIIGSNDMRPKPKKWLCQ